MGGAFSCFAGIDVKNPENRSQIGWVVDFGVSIARRCDFMPHFPAIVQQTPTKIFLPNPDAEYKGSYERCGITEKEYLELVKLSVDSRTFLVKQSKQSAFGCLNLHGFSDEMAVLSGSADNVDCCTV